ncbi:MICAL-like protein 1 isoform X2 [Liolophura sinensis]|uniref:MICAL-like protein 1 isoform X2 n=1 Tax=Liolophura sinensis TaxID=3198878 RepID=UPI0031591873
MAMSKIKALQTWCKRTLEGYRDVNITDMTTSWRNGLAFCAMIHKFRPDLIDYDALDKENVYENNKLAFDVAEKELNIAALLEAADMVAMKVPDRLSIITYVAQYHNYFKDKPVLGGPGISVANKTATPSGTKRHHEGSEPQSRPEVKRFTPSHENKQDKSQEKAKHQRVASMGETCQICRNKVYLLERHIEDGKLYHRSCYRHSDLSPSGKVYAKPSALFEKDEKKDSGKEDIRVNGMSQLGKGFAAPEKSAGQRSRSPARGTARVALNINSHSEEKYKPRSHKQDDVESRKKTTDNGHSEDHRSNAKSVLDKLEKEGRSDWRNKRSHSPKAERKPYSSSTQRPSDLPGRLSEPSEKKVTDKWPPSKDEKSSRSRSEGIDQRATPVPRPRQSLLKEEENSTKIDSNHERSRFSRDVEKMEVDETVTKPLKNSYSSELETRLTKRTEPRKLPLALQSGVNDKSEDNNNLSKSDKKESADITNPTPKTRLFLKKNDKKLSGSNEKLNKTVGERIKESKERTKLRSQEERSKTKSEDKSDRFSIDRSKSVTPPAITPDEPSSAPPLPRSTPPELPKSQPSQPTSPSTAPPRPPRSPTTPHSAPTPTPRSGPPKPPRVGLTDATSKETSTEDALSKAGQQNRGSPPVAIMVYPDSRPPQEEADQRVLGGLLKSLANVRQRQPGSPTRPELTTESKTSVVIPPRSPVSNATESNVLSNNIKNSNNKTTANVDSKPKEQSHISKSKHNEKASSNNEVIDTTPIPAWQKEVARRKAEKDSKSKQRPKSTTAILDYLHDKEEIENSHVQDIPRENKPLPTPVVDTTPTPAWQKEARRRKENGNAKPARPKSMDVLSDENGDLCVGEDNLKVLNLTKDLKKRDKKPKEFSKSQESVPDWQKEAQKRMEERKGNFVDPEKKRLVPERQVCPEKKRVVPERPVDPEKKRVVPERPERPNLNKTTKKHIEIIENGDNTEKKNVGKSERTKVSPGMKFNFDDSSLDSSSEFQQKEKHKKGRQPPPRPKSPPAVNRAQKHQKYLAGNRTSPLRPGMSPGKLTPMEIQRQLLDIDSKLTDLELKGRRLEDSIRNDHLREKPRAQEDEEDMLMIDWFLLVSQKNELVRQEADLIYASRENELEDEQDSVQDQLRRLLDKPNKTSEDKQEEEYLLERLLYIVDQRSKIIDCIDDDKHRYEEEDREIAIVLEKKAFGDASF